MVVGLYLGLHTVGLVLTYVVLVYGLAWFFAIGPARVSWRSALSVAVVTIVAIWASAQIYDEQLANRVQHVLAGGLAGFLVCALAARDSGLSIGRLRFVLIAVLLVTFMGVGNELIEFFLDSYTPLLFSSSRLDTWLDLASNVVGIALGALCFSALIPRGVRST